MKSYKNLSLVFIGLLATNHCTSFNEIMPPEPGKPATSHSSHGIPPENIIEAIRADNNARRSHNQSEQETKQIVAPKNTDYPTDSSPSKIVDNISLDKPTNANKTQSQDSSALKMNPNNPSQMTMQELIPLFTKYVNKIDGLTSDDIEVLKRLFKSSYAQTYHPKLFDPKSMIPNMTMKDYVTPLQARFPNTPPFMLEQYVDMVLAESKSGQSGWFRKSPVLTPQDVLNYDQKYQKKEFGTFIITTSDAQILFRNMQVIEKIEKFNRIEQLKQENVDRANKQRAARTITKKITGKKSIPAIETEKVTFNSFTRIGAPTTEEIENLMVRQYFPNKNRRDISVSNVQGGGNNGAMYSVSFKNKPVFFLKISTSEGSDKRLIKMQQNFIGRFGMQSRYESALNSHTQKNLPIITWIEKLYTYKYKDSPDITIEMMHAAKGRSLTDIIVNDYSIESRLASLTATGKALGSFQQFFINYVDPNSPETWETISHNDFQPNNIFFDASTSQVSLIDNESMTGRVLKSDQGTVNADIWSFFYAISINCGESKTCMGIPTSQLYNSFIQGYIESFPANKRSVLAKYLKKAISILPKEFLDSYITPPTQSEAPKINHPELA
ncbi:MAG: hypothetical protein Q8Q60_05200 [Candidatus Chromulinivorax sp.]|nr:hypothetical protein [Candidatus Chromulinivorax sp.]